MPIDAQSQRSAKILLNLSAGLDELGKPFPDGAARLTSNLRLAASSGAAALGQLQEQAVSTPAADLPVAPSGSAPVEGVAPRAQGRSTPAEMVTVPEWLDRLRQAKGFHADIALAEYLKVSKHLFSQWRTGKTAPTTDEAWRIATELGVNPLMVIACVGYQFSPREKRQVWLDLASTLIPRSQATPTAAPVPVSPVVKPSLEQAGDQVTPAVHAVERSPADAVPGPEMQGAKWTKEQDAQLIEDYQSLTPVPAIAAKHRRSIGAILYRLDRADQIPEDVMKALCAQHGVTYRPKARAPE
jgi:transcriptional regulator with XRE-family HTH domain